MIKNMKVKLTLGDVIYITFMFFCMLSLIVNSICGWWYIYHQGFSIQQLLINLVVTSATIFWMWAAFKYIFIIEIKKLKK
jgi:uncharacterized membrane protein